MESGRGLTFEPGLTFALVKTTLVELTLENNMCLILFIHVVDHPSPYRPPLPDTVS